ncbi:uncharacterized protein LOC108098603 isoform X2 [Drosophila ficusphila]|uniref:uncharacterized protein LOC108098603 isoform X2 n=1 Tax=Drosophila ficusphila TaxID=30025 RepID=UPI0007E7E11E|nr:uncharacterized protein LOC108098603 isoform X2 [Drosophila ficusphila]
MKKRSANNEPSPFPYKVIKKEFVKPSTEEKIRILNEKMDMVLRNQRKMLGVLRQMITQPSDSFGPKIISINSIRQMMSPESEDWFPQSFPLVELQQIETIEEEMNDPIKSSLYIQTMKDILKPDGTFRPGGLKKHFHLIFAIEFLVEFNFDGIHNKIPLKKFDNFNNALILEARRVF